MSDEIVRRNKGAAKKEKIKRSSAELENGDSSKHVRRNRRRDVRNRRLFFLFSVAGLLILLSSLLVRPGKRRHVGIDSGRFARAKALRDAAFKSGNGFLRKTKEKLSSTLNKKHKHSKNKSQYDLKKKFRGMRYLDPRQLPPLPGEPSEEYHGERHAQRGFVGDGDDDWVPIAEALDKNVGPKVDYTKYKYSYPELVLEPQNDGSYPLLEPMLKVFQTWEQDDLDSPPETIVEVLQHFDYQDPVQLEAAVKYRNLELPFKVYNVPEVAAAGLKWTDEYLASHFDGVKDGIPQSSGMCQQSVDHFFAFHRAEIWDVDVLGDPPSLDLNWNFDKWARHSVYADAVGLPINETHYYWQSGVPKGERLRSEKSWTFVSRDLPSFSSPKPTFFGFNPPEQKGIQCRFGERGVTAATHYDGGRNMIAMMTGAKRYILSPPNACPQLGVVTSRHHPSYRHSMLNFGRVTLVGKDARSSDVNMSDREKDWLKIAGNAPTLSTVLKASEVLYLPSHWFHYIVSLQKSAQCNTRSGIQKEGNPNFGGLHDVEQCIGE
ncbi:hypothetical protein HJC23_009975 [Cyclotella cryptica]|uniref:JmjC domain-containing protein n=1 Tax=Cyclotella cryptica TaxID=29204 RepID=A0ABD3Q936_9STRA|eukprot:CCRYP_007745-RA/>CCRYP_007745-RA protein AED:0.06 eAED:0.06 QI:334/1/1/1/1/1/2/1651/546